MTPIPLGYGKRPSCDLVVEPGRGQPSVRISLPPESRQCSRATFSSSCRTSTGATLPAAMAIRSLSRRISMQSPPAAPCSATPTRPARSAFPHAPRWQPGGGCTRRSRGTTRPPITANRRAGITGCGRTGTGSSPSASCISATRPTTTASARRSFRCTCSRAKAIWSACCASRLPRGAACRRWPRARVPASRPTTTMTAPSRLQLANGSPPKGDARAISHGRCSSRSCGRTFL